LESYLNLSAEALADQLASDIISYMAVYALANSCTYGAPSGGQTALADRLADSATFVIAADCTEVCADSVSVDDDTGGCSSSIETCNN